MNRDTNEAHECEIWQLMGGLQFFADSAEAGAEDAGGTSATDELSGFEAGLLGDDYAPEEDEGAEEQPAEAAEEKSPEEQSGAEAAGAQSETEQKQENAEQPTQTVPLTFLGRTAQIDTAALGSIAGALGGTPQSVIDMLQKGMNYEAKNHREIGILEDYAAAAGMSLEQYIDALDKERGNALLESEMQRVRGEYPEETPEEAIKKIAEGNLSQKQAARQQERAETARQQAAGDYRRRVDGWAALYAEHPELRAEGALPEDVMNEVLQRHCSPSEAFARYQSAQQTAKINELTKQLTAEKQNTKNRNAAVGPMGSAGEVESDPFLNAFLGKE